MTKLLLIFLICVVCVGAQMGPEVNNPHKMWPDKPFLDNIWNSPEQLQPYYDFILKVRSVLERAMKGEEYHVGKNWPTINHFYHRTLDCVYLQTSDNGRQVKYLWTPFGEIHLLGGGWLDALERMSTVFMEEIKTICTLEDVTGKVELSYWHYGEIQKSGYLGNGLYKLTWNEHNVTCSNEIFIHVSTNIKYKRELEIFSLLSDNEF